MPHGKQQQNPVLLQDDGGRFRHLKHTQIRVADFLSTLKFCPRLLNVRIAREAETETLGKIKCFQSQNARVEFNQAGSDTLKTKLNSFGSKLRN